MSNPEIPEVDVAAARALLDAGRHVFVDIRDPGSFGAGHIPGAQNINDGNVREFLESTPKEQPMVVVCYHGHSSRGATAFFLEQGYADVASLVGGFTHWQQTGQPWQPEP